MQRVVNIPEIQPMTPALYGLTQYHAYAIIDKNWDRAVQVIGRGEIAYNLTVFFYQARRITGEAPEDIARLAIQTWKRLVGKDNSDDLDLFEEGALRGLSTTYYQVLEFSPPPGTGGPQKSHAEAVQIWEAQLMIPIQRRRDEMLAWIKGQI